MTREEVKKLMAAVRAAWPGFYRGADTATLRAAMALWAEALADAYGFAVTAVPPEVEEALKEQDEQ